MTSRNIISYSFLILTLVVVQLLFLKNLAVFGQAFGFLYLLGLLVLPSTLRTIPLMILAFFLGLSIDLFFQTLGMHTAAATCFAFFKHIWLKISSPSGSYEESEEPTLSQIGLVRYVSFALPLLFLYSLVFFVADHWGTGTFIPVVSKSFFSSVFTLLLTILVQLLFFKRKRGIS